jgi:hypothetical protein
MSVVATQHDLFRRSVKQRPSTELVCEYVFRPAAQLAVLALRPFSSRPEIGLTAGDVVV